MKERDDQMLRDKLRKVWNILWLCLWILSCIGGLIEAMRIPAANAGKTGLDGATGFDLVILGFLLLSFQEWGLAVYLTGRYFLQKKEKKSPWKTVFYILLFVVAVILLPLSAMNDSILLFELGVLFMPFVLGGIVWKILRGKTRCALQCQPGDLLEYRED